MTPGLYAWLKALHVAAAVTFVAGVLGAAVFLAAADRHGAEMARAVRRWDITVTTPAMLLVWALGLTLAQAGHWLPEQWLLVKLAFVVALSGLHGVQSAKLRRLAGGATPAMPSRLVAPLVVGAVVVIAILAVVKPL